MICTKSHGYHHLNDSAKIWPQAAPLLGLQSPNCPLLWQIMGCYEDVYRLLINIINTTYETHDLFNTGIIPVPVSEVGLAPLASKVFV